MNKQELKSILHTLGLDAECEPTVLYVFYRMPDGWVSNFSLSLREGERMSDEEVVELMRREYPATREAAPLAVERPEGVRWLPTEWVDTADLCQWLKVSRRTVERWMSRGLIKGYRMGGRLYFSRSEVDRALIEGRVKQNVSD
ncbi:MAG: helix-turn-helix domain-containing protein [Bacteroidales bacterium]|nr:helix-turn-helix domain-containing protein [Bacteroidales bacterium]